MRVSLRQASSPLAITVDKLNDSGSVRSIATKLISVENYVVSELSFFFTEGDSIARQICTTFNNDITISDRWETIASVTVF